MDLSGTACIGVGAYAQKQLSTAEEPEVPSAESATLGAPSRFQHSIFYIWLIKKRSLPNEFWL